LSIKTRLIGGTSALVLAGSMIAFAAPAAHAAVLSVGGCTNLLALGTAKSTGVGHGITDKDNQDGSVSSKGVDPNNNKGTSLGACGFNGGLSTPDAGKPPVKGYSGIKTVAKWGTKLFSPETDCNTTDGTSGPNPTDNTEWPLNGTLSLTFTDLTAASKAQALTAQIVVDGFTDGDPSTPLVQDTSDVVSFHGIVIKGVAAGADVTGETEFDPTVKDKTVTTGATAGPFGNAYFGYAFDVAAAVGCTDDASVNPANITAFNNGSVSNASQILGLPVSGINFTIGS